MKIIHCGDIHLDSRLESNLPDSASRTRKKEIIMAFRRMVDYAVENGVTAVVIAGDLFDSERMLDTTRDAVLGKIAEAPDVQFLYLIGNHDMGGKLLNSPLPENFKTFGDSWTTFEFGNVAVTGVALTEENCRHIYGSLKLSEDKVNIVTMHGELGTAYSSQSINRNELSDKNIDYLALGHYHSFQSGNLGKNGVWCYCGCLEGRGFDECGDKGFVVLDIDTNGQLKYEFHKSSIRDIVEVECDISGVGDTSEMLKIINNSTVNVSTDAMLKVVLTGDIPADARKDTELFKKELSNKFWFVKLKDKTRIILNPEDYINDISLKGEFIRKVLASELDEETRQRVIECGLAVLSGREVL